MTPDTDDRPADDGPVATDIIAESHPPRRASLRLRRCRPLSGRALLLVVLLLPVAVVYVVSLPKQNFYNPPFNPRYLVIFTPFYSILLAWGLAAIGEWIGAKGSRGAGEQGRRR